MKEVNLTMEEWQRLAATTAEPMERYFCMASGGNS
jgi:hypothetical protein